MLNYEKQSPEYDFPLTFDCQKKLTELCPFFQKKSKNYTNGGRVRETPLCDFRFFSMLNYGKRSLESDFPFVSDRPRRKLF